MLLKGLAAAVMTIGLSPCAFAQFTISGPGYPPMTFKEADGLQSQTQSIEARHSDSSTFYPVKMPGLGSVGNITLRNGTVSNQAHFWDFYSSVTMNTISRATLTLQGPRGITWTLNNAWPTRITGTNLHDTGEQVNITSMEIAYESLTVGYPQD